jgi:transcriptional regulator with XRE-family HTH domain
VVIDLEELKKTQEHPLKPIFDRYSRQKLAGLLGVHPQYLGSILIGTSRPGPALAKRMQELAESIEAAEQRGA